MATAAERVGGIDIVVANAGIGAVGDVAGNEDADRWKPSSGRADVAPALGPIGAAEPRSRFRLSLVRFVDELLSIDGGQGG